jgi:hypothetical protein
MLRTAIFAGLAAALLPFQATAGNTGQETITVWEVDTSGRPPFERRRVEVPVADTASAETVTETVTVWTADYSGRPPFRRSYQSVPVVDAASFEAGAETIQPVAPRPFHKTRHR